MKKTILIIDDEKDIRDDVAEILELAGYNPLIAGNGKKGVEIALKEKPDLIICDILMPELDGYGVLYVLRNKPEMQHIPFIFLTAKTEKNDFRKGMQMGADDFLTKPCGESELLNAVEVRLRKAEILRQQYEPGRHGITSFLADLKKSGFGPQLSDYYETHKFSKKQVLYHEGKRPRYLFYIINGKAKTVKTHPDGKDYITDIYSSGDFIGYSAIVDDSNYDDTAIILEESDIIEIPKEDFLELLNSDINLALKFIKLAAHSAKEKEDRLVDLAYSSLRKRIANALIELNNKFNPAHEPGKLLHLTREDVARYVGTATESLIRTITDFRNEKLVDIDKDGKISITDLNRLGNLLN